MDTASDGNCNPNRTVVPCNVTRTPYTVATCLVETDIVTVDTGVAIVGASRIVPTSGVRDIVAGTWP